MRVFMNTIVHDCTGVKLMLLRWCVALRLECCSVCGSSHGGISIHGGICQDGALGVALGSCDDVVLASGGSGVLQQP